MSDDLISRKALLKQFIISDSGRRIPEYDADNFPVTISIKDVKDIIRKASIAFDKEKVIEELKGEIELVVHNPMIAGRYIKKSRVIEIVEKGGIE